MIFSRISSLAGRLDQSRKMRSVFLTLILVYLLLPIAQGQIITPVRDQDHIETSHVETYSAAVSTSIKAILENGFIDKISKVQEFLKLASEVISAVVKNLKMTQELIKTEQEIFQLYTRYLKRLTLKINGNTAGYSVNSFLNPIASLKYLI